MRKASASNWYCEAIAYKLLGLSVLKLFVAFHCSLLLFIKLKNDANTRRIIILLFVNPNPIIFFIYPDDQV